MAPRNHSLTPPRPAGARALWGYLKDSVVTEFRSSLRLLAAPVRAIGAGSLDPIKSAFRRAQEDSARVFARYSRTH
jgi:hypothetical protein